MKRTPLKRKTPLKAKKGLKRKTALTARRGRKKGPKKQRSIAGLLNDVKEVFNRYIRERAGRGSHNGIVRCCSCGKPYQWEKLDAGHYIHGCAPLRFDEYNVHPQCKRCNRHEHGNGARYAAFIAAQYGPIMVAWLDAIKQDNSMKPKRWKHSELLELLDIYTKKLAELRKQ